ncbi:MAG: hypothetical protein AAFR90_15260, partial [Pseudomonadota bacterium]
SSRLLPTRPVKDFHLQSSAHAGHTCVFLLARQAFGLRDGHNPIRYQGLVRVELSARYRRDACLGSLMRSGRHRGPPKS